MDGREPLEEPEVVNPAVHLFQAEGPRLSRYFRRHLSAPDDAPDLVQEAFARLLRATATRVIDNPAAYLQRIARNLLFKKVRGGSETLPLTAPEAANALRSPAEQGRNLEAEQLMLAYQAALAALPPRTRQVFQLHRVEELSYREIAARLDIKLRTVEWHMTEALFRIRRSIDEG